MNSNIADMTEMISTIEAESILWDSPPDKVELTHHEAHVWHALLEPTPERVHQLSALLSVDERDRADKFSFKLDRSRFISARGGLRILIGRYLSKDPARLQFWYGPYGKPFLAGVDAAKLQFNVTHSGGRVLYAVAYGREIGVDLERINTKVSVEAIAESFFSINEVAELQLLSGEQKYRAFFGFWARKESYVKARGDGLTAMSSRFGLSIGPTEVEPLRQGKRSPSALAKWTMTMLDVGPEYMGALMVEGHGWLLKCWQFEMS